MLERSFVKINGEDFQWNDDTMTFLDIEETEMGYDLVTFEYKDTEYKSYIFRK